MSPDGGHAPRVRLAFASRSGAGSRVMPLLLAVVILLVFDLAYPRLGIVHVHDPILTRFRQTF